MLMLSYDSKAVSVMEEVLQKKLTKVLAAAGNPRRLYSSRRSGPTPAAAPLKRALSVHSSVGWPKHELAALKCLTVIVYLCQYGSHAFMQWLRTQYRTIVQPLARLAFLPQYANAIYLKVSMVVRYCESSTELASSRRSVDEIRLDIRPGLVGLLRSLSHQPQKPLALAPMVSVKRTGSPRQPNLLSLMEDGTMCLSGKKHLGAAYVGL